MNDYENWKNGEYFGDARKFWDGAMIGIDSWVEQMRASENASTSDEALPIADVVGQSEQLCCQFCGSEDGKHGWTDDGEVCPLDRTA